MLIAFLGDSLTEGWPGAAFFPLLDRRMTEHGLLNRGRAGDTVADLLNRMRYQGLQPVDAAFVWVGANDAVIGAWDAAEPGSGWSWPERLTRLAGDYEELLEWTEARARRIVVVLPLVLEADGSLWEERAGEAAEAISHIATGRPSCRVVDLAPSFDAAAAAGEGPFTTDGVHFTDAGAEVVAQTFAVVIDELEAEDLAGAGASPDEA
jgi:lysophospholipase L1-like esterase